MRDKIEFMQKYYYWFAGLRDKLFMPIAHFLTFIKVKPTLLSFFRIIFALLFIASINKSYILSLAFLVVGIFSDALDGVLARFQGTASDKGKFIDVTADNLFFILFVIGLVYGKLLSGFAATVFLCAFFPSIVFRAAHHARCLPSDWRFKTVVGFLPNLFEYLLYVLFLIFTFFQIGSFEFFVSLFAVPLFVDALVFFKKNLA